MTLSKIKIWKDVVWRASYTLNGRPCELSYPGEFPGFVSYVRDSILGFIGVFRELQPRTSTPVKDALEGK